MMIPRYSPVFPNALTLTVLITAAGAALMWVLPAMLAFHVAAAILPGFGALGTNYAGRHEGGWNFNVLLTAICAVVLLGALLEAHLPELIEVAKTAPESLLQALIVSVSSS